MTLIVRHLLATETGQLIIEHIIPAISRLRMSQPLLMDTLFSPSQLAKINVNSDTLNCADIMQSDLILEMIRTK